MTTVNQSPARLIRLMALGLLICLPGLGQAAGWSKFKTPTEHEPQAVGKYANGCLLGGEALPDSGPGYQAVRLGRKRNFGHPEMVDYIQQLGVRVADRKLGIMLVADMAMPRGGRFTSGHASHQSGLDADIWLRLGAPKLPASQRQGYNDVRAVLLVDRRRLEVTPSFEWKHAELIRQAALDDRVARIFVHPAIKKNLCERRWETSRSWLRKVRPWWGHDSHFHVRLRCPAGSTNCENQPAPPPGEGCDEPDTWIAEMRNPPKRPATPSKPKPPPPPPEQCRELLTQR
ncbi:MAG: penicillin-insensitive murein endopeptidase [Salinisphaeraceae bacterium]|nr:penicillin-insensitive murein endopeptidase [Salinisphaeraceae bacterium]